MSDLAQKIAPGIRSSIEGRAQGDFEHYLRLSEITTDRKFAAWCLDKAWEARQLVGAGYMRRRLTRS